MVVVVMMAAVTAENKLREANGMALYEGVIGAFLVKSEHSQ